MNCLLLLLLLCCCGGNNGCCGRNRRYDMDRRNDCDKDCDSCDGERRRRMDSSDWNDNDCSCKDYASDRSESRKFSHPLKQDFPGIGRGETCGCEEE